MLLFIFARANIAFLESLFDNVIGTLAVKLDQAILHILYYHGHPFSVRAEFYTLEQLEIQVAVIDPGGSLFGSRWIQQGVGLEGR